ncbi:hypothetical protein ACO2Q7_15255 [Rathayibacter sp. KR2-224]|uniref:hypothetical protein n=1 Tax=Rathayibacter sp. KR2-224 TaxID=3400913 RepID=UPI003C063076
MTGTQRKPLWRWEPAPYLLLILLLIATASVPPGQLPILYWTLVVITAIVAVILVALLVVQLGRGPRNPDASGMLSGLGGIELKALPTTAAPSTPVVGTTRHQGAIESARARAGTSPSAVLVPDATRWLGLRIRIAVHLVASERVHHVGFLPERATERYNERLRALAAERRFVSVPATIKGEASPYAIDVDLGALADMAEAASPPADPR